MATPRKPPAQPPSQPRRPVVKRSSAQSGNVLTPPARLNVDSLSGEQLTADALSIRQRNAARLLAIGMSQQQAADGVGVDVRTVRRWCDDRAFAEMVEELHALAWSRVEHAVMAMLEQAIGVMQAMLRGEVAPDDKRYVEASRLVERLIARLFSIAAPPAPGTAAEPDGALPPAGGAVPAQLVEPGAA